jgi:hypothetical protein
MEDRRPQPRIACPDTEEGEETSYRRAVAWESVTRPFERGRHAALTRPLVLVLLAIARLGTAATIDVNAVEGGDSAIVVVTGRLEVVDGDRFVSAVSRYENATIVLNSDGGNLVAGLEMGNVIRARRYTTLVPDGVHCASACAFAWLGGTRRLMGTEARIGFHAAYRMEDGQPAESGVGNALVGAYLARIGLPDRAVVYITQAAPTDMTWLTMDEARAEGIDVELRLSPSAHAHVAPPTALPSVTVSRPRAADAIALANEYWVRWSGNDRQALTFLARSYAGEVEFYGRRLSRHGVMEEKRRFVERWPQRVYSVRPASLSARCTPDASTCMVDGIVDWDCRSARRAVRSVGAASFTFQIALSTTGPAIVRESGSLIQRRVGH